MREQASERNEPSKQEPGKRGVLFSQRGDEAPRSFASIRYMYIYIHSIRTYKAWKEHGRVREVGGGGGGGGRLARHHLSLSRPRGNSRRCCRTLPIHPVHPLYRARSSFPLSPRRSTLNEQERKYPSARGTRLLRSTRTERWRQKKKSRVREREQNPELLLLLLARRFRNERATSRING